MSFSRINILIGVCLCVASAMAQQEGGGSCGSPLLTDYRSHLMLRGRDSCKVLEESRCAKYGYYHTTERNFLNHHSQQEASRQLSNYEQLIASNCSNELEFLLCNFHFPICLPKLRDPVQPCKSMCQRVRDSCSPLLQRQGYAWPRALDCGRLQEQSTICDGTPEVCVNEVGPVVNQVAPTASSSSTERARPTERLTEFVSRRPQVPPGPLPSPNQCLVKCGKVDISKKQPRGTQWAFIGKVRSASLMPSGKMLYVIKVHKPLRVISKDPAVLRQLTKGSLVRVTVKAKRSTGCACPLLERRRRYILTGRVGDGSDLRMRQGDGAVLYQGRRHNLREILPLWLRHWMGIE